MNTAAHVVVLAKGVDLKSGWSKFFGLFPATLITTMAVFGVGAIIYAIVFYAWGKFRNRPAGGSIGWAFLFGLLLAAPAVFGPLALGLVDVMSTLVINAAGTMGA